MVADVIGWEAGRGKCTINEIEEGVCNSKCDDVIQLCQDEGKL